MIHGSWYVVITWISSGQKTGIPQKGGPTGTLLEKCWDGLGVASIKH